jgi:DnaJ-class molecular chaperone
MSSYWNDALQSAEQEMWDTIVESSTPGDGDSSEAAAEVLDDTVACDGCPGTGIYHGAGYVENGVFKGFVGTCFRCGGKGRQTPSDVKRNWGYDRNRRFVP